MAVWIAGSTAQHHGSPLPSPSLNHRGFCSGGTTAHLLQHVQGDFADFGFAVLDVGAQERPGVIRFPIQDQVQNFRMLFVSDVDPGLLGEVEVPDDADSLGDVLVNARQFGVAGCFNQLTMKTFVQGTNRYGIGQTICRVGEPSMGEPIQNGHGGTGAQAIHGGEFQNGPNVVKLFKLWEIERFYLPAAAEMNFHKPILLQAIQRFAHRSAARLHPVGDLCLGKSFSRNELEAANVLS